MNTEKCRMQLLLLLLFMILVAAGCSSQPDNKASSGEKSNDTEEKNTNNKEDKGKTEEPSEEATEFFSNLPELPTNLEEMLAYPVGKFAGQKYEKNAEEIEKVLDQFPRTDEKVNQETLTNYWNKLVTLFAEDYPDPQNIVNKWGAFSFGGPGVEDPKLQFKENYNVEIILDSSGSMAATVGNKSRMKLAKESILNFVKDLPEESNVGLRVYGFKGSNAVSDKKLSCGSNELVYGLKPYDEAGFKKALDKFSPTGWTPLAKAIELAQNDLSAFKGEKNTNIIYIVSDGVETCDGDPVMSAKSLGDSDITPIVNVIGFDVDNEGQAQLKSVAEASGGTYSYVEDQEQLQDEFQRAADIASKWRLWKANKMGDARMESVKRANMIRDNRGVWSDKYKLERHNYNEASNYLQEQNIISMETSLALNDLRGKRLDIISSLQDQIFDYLFDLKDKQMNEVKQEISEMYDTGVK